MELSIFSLSRLGVHSLAVRSQRLGAGGDSETSLCDRLPAVHMSRLAFLSVVLFLDRALKPDESPSFYEIVPHLQEVKRTGRSMPRERIRCNCASLTFSCHKLRHGRLRTRLLTEHHQVLRLVDGAKEAFLVGGLDQTL
jgi:hypothetical protein